MIQLRSAPGSTSRLALYTSLYFSFYGLFGLLVKVFQRAGLSDVQFLVYSTLGSALVCLGVILGAKWWRARFTLREIAYILLAGTFTAVVIPTTTLMYSLPISVMVAMVLMRGSILVVTRAVDTVLHWQGLSHKAVRWEENLAVLAALSAVGLNILFAQAEDFDFLRSPEALTILGVYLVAYSLRIYLMNYFKFTRKEARSGPAEVRERLPRGGDANNKNYFALEQLSASAWIFGFTGLSLAGHGYSGVETALTQPHSLWLWAALAGLPFGLAAFFSVFLFMFEGRTSTFSGLANRLSSLLAGTMSTLLFAFFFGGAWPHRADWAAFALLICAVALLWRAETRRPS